MGDTTRVTATVRNETTWRDAIHELAAFERPSASDGERRAAEWIAARLPTLVGIKQAVNDLGHTSQLLQRFGPEFRVFVGLEELSFPMLAVGATGLMNAVGNLAPRKIARLCEAVASGALSEGRALHFELFELNRAVFWDTNPIPVKYMMKRLGLIAENEHRLPMLPADKSLADRLDAVLERAKLEPVSLRAAAT